LILRKIIKIVATRCQILRLKCTKFDFGPLAGFKGAYTSKGKRREEREWEEREEEEGTEERGGERNKNPPSDSSGYGPAACTFSNSQQKSHS